MIIKTTAWHYKYYTLVKKLWGGRNTYIPAETNLCAYVQTMIWGTFFWVALLPLMPFQILFYAIDIPANLINKQVEPSDTPFVAKTFMGIMLALCLVGLWWGGMFSWFFVTMHTGATLTVLAIAILLSLVIAFKTKICPIIYFDKKDRF